MPSERTEPLNDPGDDGGLFWRKQADSAWRTYMETGDPGDCQDALIAADNYHRWVDAIDDALQRLTDDAE